MPRSTAYVNVLEYSAEIYTSTTLISREMVPGRCDFLRFTAVPLLLCFLNCQLFKSPGSFTGELGESVKERKPVAEKDRK